MPPSLTSSVRSWRVAVLLDDEHLVVVGDEVDHLVGEREGAQPQGVEVDAAAPPARQRLVHRRRGRAEVDQRRSGSACAASRADRLRHQRLGGLELAQQALHVVDVDGALLAVAGVAVARGAAGEEGAALADACPDRCGRGCRRRRRRGSGRTRGRPRGLARSSPCRGRAARRRPMRAARTATRSCRCRGRACTKTGGLQPVGEVEGLGRHLEAFARDPRGTAGRAWCRRGEA